MKQTVLQKDILQQFQYLLEDWIPKNAAIAIATEGKYVFFASPNENMQIQVGTPIQENSIAFRVLQTNNKVDAIIDNSLFDSPYYAIGYPMTIEGHQAALIVVMPPNFTLPKHEPYRFLTGRQNEEWVPIAVEHITYIESLQKHTWFYKEKSQYKTSITLKELETRLPDTFIRIHRSYIINISFIKKITRDITSNYVIVLTNDVKLPISQSYLQVVRKILQF